MYIRLATTDDASAMSGLMRPLAEKFIAHEFSTEAASLLLNSLTPEVIRDNLARGFRYHIAEEEGILMGVVPTQDEPEFATGDGEGGL